MSLPQSVMADACPWFGAYGDVPHSIAYPEIGVYEAVGRTISRLPDHPALTYFGAITTYGEFGRLVERCAGAFAALGMKRGDRITIALPTCPQAIIAFYAANRIGAVPAMMHPLSSTPEIDRAVRLSGSRFGLTLDALYGSFAAIPRDGPLETLILTSISDHMPPLKRMAFRLTKGRRLAPVPNDAPVKWWPKLLEHAPAAPRAADVGVDDVAVILFSGGTMGTPKGIALSHRNLISEGMALAAWTKLGSSDTILAALPVFHGFGLNALVNAGLMSGCRLILVPVFSAEIVAQVLQSQRPTVMAGVPTLYDALTREPVLHRADLSQLRAAYSGADRLPGPVKDRFERMVAERGGRITLLEGYGLTETVTAVIAMPLTGGPAGCIGTPIPDVLVKICRPGEDSEVAPGQEGEICIAGPTVMLGYLNDAAATAKVLKTHADGRVWLHTRDLGHMDAAGFVYYHCRLKRMIKSSGFNVYPAEVEATLDEHPAVAEACVVGTPDASQGERVTAVVALKDPRGASPALADELIAHCRARLIKWSCPRVIVFRPALPTTRLGKVDFRALQRDLAAARPS